MKRGEQIMRGTELRDAIKNANLFQWQVAEEIGMSDSHFNKCLRHNTEVKAEFEEKVLTAIGTLAK